jgi:TRAP-type C4-dicarboxylate transport system substrate-binding protein
MSASIGGWTLASVLWVVACAPAMAAEIAWRAPIWGPKRASSESLVWLAKEVAAKTGGQMKIELGFDQGKPGEVVDKLKSGAVDLTYVCTPYFADKMPLSTVINLPLFAPQSTRVLGQVELALAEQPAIQAEVRKWNVKMLMPVPLPQYQLMSTRRIARLDDFKGARVRAIPEMAKVLVDYGAIILEMPVADALPIMKSGGLDAIVLPTYAFYSYGVHETAKYLTDKISLGAQFCYLGASQKAWDALPGPLQKAVLDLRQPLLARFDEHYARENAATTAAMQQKGVELVAFSQTDRARLIAKAIKYWQAWVEEREKQGLKGREVFEFTQAKIRELSR